MSASQIHYLPVNWIDGMKINKSHFIDQDLASLARVAGGTTCFLNIHNYGLLPEYSHQHAQGLKVSLVTENQQYVQVRIARCKGVTLGGHVIEIDGGVPALDGYATLPIPDLMVSVGGSKKKKTRYLIVLVVNPYERMPFGEADPFEMPPRLPYSVPSYSLHLVPEEELSPQAIGDFQLPLGRILVDEHRGILDENYIPPCSTIASHPALVDLHANVERFFGKLESNAMQILQKIHQKKQQSEMAHIVQRICENIVVFTAGQIGKLRRIQLYQPPVFLIDQVSGLAKVIKNSIDPYIGSGKEELVNYCVEWCEMKQGELEAAAAEATNIHYDHLDINASIEKLVVFVRYTDLLFTSLSKLEYIGKRKDTGIFVKEHSEQSDAGKYQIEVQSPIAAEESSKKRRSFFIE